MNIKGGNKTKYFIPYNRSTNNSTSNRLVCKHSILMLLMFHSPETFNSWQGRSDVRVNNLVFFFKPSKIRYFTLLRAPYRYKIARNQISFKRFFLKCSIILQVLAERPFLRLSNSYSYLTVTSEALVALYRDLDTNVCKQDNITISVPFIYPNYFCIKNYK
jgi:hypothetical protein